MGDGNRGQKNGTAPDYRFPARERLKARDEIREVFNRKKLVSCAGAKLFTRPNGLEYNRVAFTFSRKFGNAVERNRSRRLSREAYRFLRGGLRQGFDMVLLVYPDEKARDKPKAGLNTRMDQLRRLFSRAGLFLPFSPVIGN